MVQEHQFVNCAYHESLGLWFLQIVQRTVISFCINDFSPEVTNLLSTAKYFYYICDRISENGSKSHIFISEYLLL